MGGRGSKSGLSATGSLSAGFQSIAGQIGPAPNGMSSLQGVYAPGWDDNGNPAVQKWQGQEPDKAARFLAKVHNDVDFANYDDGYGFYEGDFQKFSLAMGMDKGPTVLPDAQFDAMVKANNLQVIYRGEAGQSQVDRFMNAPRSHTGIGSYGDGFYFSDDKSVANSYAQMKGGANGRVFKAVLSPTARIITYDDLVSRMQQDGVYGPSSGSRLGNALYKQGQSARASGAKYLNKGQAQYAAKLGYNVVAGWGGYHYAIDRSAFIVSDKVKHHW